VVKVSYHSYQSLVSFQLTITLGQLLTLLSILGSAFAIVWSGRGYIDTVRYSLGARFEELNQEMKRRHRQNTARLDYLLALVNQEREENGKTCLPCPYRKILDD
jgi:hypothetical protein